MPKPVGKVVDLMRRDSYTVFAACRIDETLVKLSTPNIMCTHAQHKFNDSANAMEKGRILVNDDIGRFTQVT